MTLDRTDAHPVTNSHIQDVLIKRTGADPGMFEEADGLTLEELGLDSLAVLELEAVVADEYGLIIPEGALRMSIDEIVAQLNSQRDKA
ncbi:MAG TPA: phosphopantetheine-binding protein [Streptosporangiaceae bacterium]|nr:phosphopantetheine-binding protein [Streptosporangiaceae bacterium]